MSLQPLRILEYFAVLMYIILGLYFITQPQNFDTLPPAVPVAFGVLLILYGIYRTYRIILRQRQPKETDNEE